MPVAMSSVLIGLGACLISVVFFGSMFVPIKKFEAGDGIFVQWVMSMAILCIGFVVFAITEFPGFYPLAMLGGMFWTIGNATAIPIISRLGMAMSILIWNTTNCLTGWAGGRFGLFGMKANPPQSSILNYLGLAMVLVGGVLFSQIRSNTDGDEEVEGKRITLSMSEVEKEKLNSHSDEHSDDDLLDVDLPIVVKPKKNHSAERYFGIALALCAGVFYGVTFVPVIYMQDNPQLYPKNPKDGMSYIFSHYMGIFLTATAIFLIYGLFKKNKPTINPSIALPAFCGGILWAVAQSSFFIANDNLSQAVTFPIITTLPGCVASLWSIFYFRELRGSRNLTILAVAICITLCGAMLVGLSKAVSF